MKRWFAVIVLGLAGCGGGKLQHTSAAVTAQAKCPQAISPGPQAAAQGSRAIFAALPRLYPTLERKGAQTRLAGPLTLLEALLAHGRKGLSIQRYKGLGEMNPEQLWQTTLDPEVRSLYQVKIEHADEAGKIFETLMGDVVEPRREFIQDNALKVVNLDV